MKIERILFPTDFSEGSNDALKYAVSLSREYGAKLYLMHVIHDISATAGWHVPHMQLDQIYKEMEENASKEMERYRREGLREIKDIKMILVRGLPAEEIIKVASEEKIDLIIIGTYGRRGIERIIFGSTAEKVVRSAPCPVLSVKVPEYKL